MKLIDYIESTGTQYIDTGIYGSDKIDVEMCIIPKVGFSGWRFPLGSNQANVNRSYLIGINSLTTTTVQRGTNIYHDDQFSFQIDAEYTLKFIGTQFTINENNICTVSDQTFTSPVTMYLFACNTAGSATAFAPVALKYCKIWESGTLVRDFVPAIENRHAGLYDNVTGQFYSNAGTGDFSYPAWYMGEDGYPTTDYFPELPENAVNPPFPAMMWRIDPKMNNGFPFHGLLPDVPRQSGAFENVSQLSRVAIPESVKTIGDSAFQGTALTVVRVAADCTVEADSFPENCRILRYPAHTHGQLTDGSGRVVLDRQGRRIYARRIDNG